MTKLLVVGLFFYSISIDLIACSCGEVSPSVLIEKAEYIYAGKVIKAELIKDKGVKTTFVVIEAFKGKTDAIESVMISPKGCPIQYLVGHSYVILADRDRLVSSCTGHDYYFSSSEEKTYVPYIGILEELRKNQ